MINEVAILPKRAQVDSTGKGYVFMTLVKGMCYYYEAALTLT